MFSLGPEEEESRDKTNDLKVIKDEKKPNVLGDPSKCTKKCENNCCHDFKPSAW